MEVAWSVDLLRELLRLCLFLGAPLLAVVVAVGVGAALLQAATQLHDMTISTVSKLIAAGVAVAAAFPWLMDRLVEFTTFVLNGVVTRL